MIVAGRSLAVALLLGAVGAVAPSRGEWQHFDEGVFTFQGPADIHESVSDVVQRKSSDHRAWNYLGTRMMLDFWYRLDSCSVEGPQNKEFSFESLDVSGLPALLGIRDEQLANADSGVRFSYCRRAILLVTIPPVDSSKDNRPHCFTAVIACQTTQDQATAVEILRTVEVHKEYRLRN